ncbi:hypothetical protein DKZ29_06290 [Limosilactobacillus reuteri]|uniref:hypothetical protein n=1 Tax=Limosilactobacillus reuteri TaxID=1598 RepID=UPI000D6F564E|nr:hypothetical protein [Limosilactobacillus reuteri]PWT35143.1 hypothetical protein DKZ24_05425 [Limosilactobacillus reuteri]PWT58295.1 hypothetical protein DKZ29_06290 [Limosilactobacillus reuteri]PWT59913.1 hypothetical protein DKZ30_04500 [Limosilactobacillus reuteri]PWT66589.1 hypothetical protein DKZ28_05135 [Limosilactobacillus reuteri]
MRNYSDNFRARMNVIGNSSRKRAYNRVQRNFKEFFSDSLNKEDCIIDGIPAQAVFQDQSQSNNKDLSDDKYVIVPNSTKIGVGSYIEWRNSYWLVFTEEVKTIPTHQQVKIKHVNRTLKWLVDKDKKTICNNGKGWGAYVQNQTLYTLGVSFSGEHLPLANAKMSVYIKDTPETRAIKVGTRIFIAGQVYKVEFADYVSRVGLINWLLDENTKNPDTDNYQLEIADYYGPNGDSDNKTEHVFFESESAVNEKEWFIEGEKRVRLGRSYVLKAKRADGKDIDVDEWTIGSLEDIPLYVLEKDKNSFSFRVKDDYRFVGNVVTITAKSNDEYKNIPIKVIKKFG